MTINSGLVNQALSAVRAAIEKSSAALDEPRFVADEWTYLKECVYSTFVFSVKRFVDRLEADLAAHIGARYAVAAVNGAAAVNITLQLVGVGLGDEVLMPAGTFITTANSSRYFHALPHSLRYINDEIGYKYSCPNLNTALGFVTLEQRCPVHRRQSRLIQVL